jgi:hypothetical protein
MKTQRHHRWSVGPLALASAMGAAVLTIAGCGSLLDVKVPGNLTSDELFTPGSAPIIINSVISDFECSYSMMSAVESGMEDASWSTSGYWRQETDYLRTRPPSGACSENSDTDTDWFTSFQSSRFVAVGVYDALQDWTDAEVGGDRIAHIATAATYAGFFYAIFGEQYCEFAAGVGPMQTPRETLAVAESWFTKALDALGAGDKEIVSTTSVRQLALLGRARVRLQLDNLTGARADAAQIQPGFVAWITRDASVRSRWNAVTQGLTVSGWRTIGGAGYWNDFAPTQLISAGYYDLTIDPSGAQTVNDGMPDPRVSVTFTGQFAQDGVTDQYVQNKYPTVGDPHALAKYEEAQLILAEIDLEEGALGSAVGHINVLRDAHSLPNFASTDVNEIYRTTIEERRREFFFEGRHFADKLRYGLWFPRGRGKDHKGIQFGFGYCNLMPIDEYQLNPEVIAAFGADYEGPDITEISYTYANQQTRRTVQWPVPATLP